MDTLLLQEIGKIRENLEKYVWLFDKNETNVRSILIDPLLSILDWNFPNLRREVSIKNHGRADYILYNNNEKPLLIIEAKSNENDLMSVKEQLKKYWEGLNQYDVLALATNGQEWQLWEQSHDNCIGKIDIIKSSDYNSVYRFFKCFNAKNFSKEKAIEYIKDMGKGMSYSNDRSDKFYIIETNDNGSKIEYKENPTKNFKSFLSNHADDIIKLQDEGMLNVVLVSTRKSDVRNPQSISNGKIWVSGDFNTYTKRMLILHIADKLRLKCEILTE